jgi:hypothetical protein
LLVASLMSITLAVTISGCEYFESDEDTTSTGSSGIGSSAESFTIAPGVRKVITAQLPYTVKFDLVTSPDLKNYHEDVRAPIMIGYGPQGMPLSLGHSELLEVRTYKGKLIDQNGRYPHGYFSEPRYVPAISWQPNTTYPVEVTWTTSGVTINIGTMRCQIDGGVSPTQTMVIGWPTDGYRYPGLEGSKIIMK